MAEIAVIVVNYRAGPLVLDCVDSVLGARHPGHSVSVWLVDNDSGEEERGLLRRAAEARGWGARVTLRLERENHGFGRANNLVLRALAARPDPPAYVFLLNPDARLEGETVAALADFLEARPRAAVAGARSRKPDAPDPVTAAFRFPGIASTFSGALNFGPVSRLLARRTVALPPDMPATRVDWVSGAAAMARFGVWRDLGFFDPEFFLYYEEVDLMRRTVAAGWECWHVPQARIVHVEGASTAVRSSQARRRRPAYWYHSWQHYFRKSHGRAYALAAAAAWVAGAAGDGVISRLRGRTPSAPERFLGDFWAAGLRPLLGLPPRAR